MKKDDDKKNALIAARLKFFREQKGYSRPQLETLTGYRVRQIERYEMNRSRIPADYIADFCKLLELPTDAIYSDIANEPRLLSGQEKELIDLLKGLDIGPIVNFLKDKKGV